MTRGKVIFLWLGCVHLMACGFFCFVRGLELVGLIMIAPGLWGVIRLRKQMIWGIIVPLIKKKKN